MSQKVHRCGGNLVDSWVAIELLKAGGLLCFVPAPALKCDRCGEQLIERDVARDVEAAGKGAGAYFVLPVCVFGPEPVSSGTGGLVFHASSSVEK